MWPFNHFAAKTKETQRKISELQKELDSTKALLCAAEKELGEKSKALQDYLDSVKDSTFVVDWTAMNAFSVERDERNETVCTIIGFMRENQTKEWYLYCSEQQHEKLAAEFQAYIKDKK